MFITGCDGCIPFVLRKIQSKSKDVKCLLKKTVIIVTLTEFPFSLQTIYKKICYCFCHALHQETGPSQRKN